MAPDPNAAASPVTVLEWHNLAQWSILLVPMTWRGEFIHQIVFFVRAFRRTQHTDAIGAMFFLDG